MKKVLMVAAENDALVNAKVGGMGDVIRDLPPALLSASIQADVAMPDYGFLIRSYNALKLAQVTVPFCGQVHTIDIYKMPRPEHKQNLAKSSYHAVAETDSAEVNSWVYLFSHPLFNQADQSIYAQGSSDRPFADDASKFALFSLAVAKAICEGKLAEYDVLHLHDWHTAMIAMLRQCVDEFSGLKHLKCVYTIHNLALQGIRPYHHDSSSFISWFGYWFNQHDSVNDLPEGIADPRYSSCVNPMRMGIVMSDVVHVVSPSYAQEILRPSNPAMGFYGAEGLEADLIHKAKAGQLIGIINGCEYSSTTESKPSQNVKQCLMLINQAQQALSKWQANKDVVSSEDFIASIKLTQYQQQLESSRKNASAPMLITSVGRLTEQKVLLFLHKTQSGKNVLSELLDSLHRYNNDARFILLGSGDAVLAKQFKSIAAHFNNFIYLNGYADNVAQTLYQQGDLFLMPSSFEPCGISQMLAMKQGQPCLVHGVGGLKDTVVHDTNGWQFSGANLDQQAQAFIQQFSTCLDLFNTQDWHQVCDNAAQARFDWQSIATEYASKLYELS
ncbi:glycogen synthase [Shewanella gaetbuli]